MWMSIAVCLNDSFLQPRNSYNIMCLQLYGRNKCLLSLLNQETVWADFVRTDPDWSSQHLCCSLSFDQGSVWCVGEGGRGYRSWSVTQLGFRSSEGLYNTCGNHTATRRGSQFMIKATSAQKRWVEFTQDKGTEKVIFKGWGSHLTTDRPIAVQTVEHFDSICFIKSVVRNPFTTGSWRSQFLAPSHLHHCLQPTFTFMWLCDFIFLFLSLSFIAFVCCLFIAFGFFFYCCPLYCFGLKLWVMHIPSLVFCN